MQKQEIVVEKLSQFNNMSFSKKQWDIILRGCGCPISSHFWKALRDNNMMKSSKTYTLIDIDIHSYAVILEQYNINNRKSVARAYAKAKAQKKAREFQGITFYMVEGILTTNRPNHE